VPVVDRALPPIICGLARATRVDIERAWEAVKPAHRPRIHTFLATSDLHLEHKLRMTRDQVLTRVAQMVAYAREKCDDVEFSPMDATRADVEFTAEVLQIAVEEGATTINIPDTVGYAMPGEYGEMFRTVLARCRAPTAWC